MRIALVSSHGGHLTEMLQIIDRIKPHDYFFVTYHSSRDKDVQRLGRVYFKRNIGMNIFYMLYAFYWSLGILRREDPDVIISFGAEIAIPFFYWGRILKKKTLYVESWCRVDSLSNTGRMVYPVADAFWVQWPQLLEKCGKKAEYHGSVI